VTVSVPRGLSLSGAAHSLDRGLTVIGSHGRRARFTARIRHGALTISLASAASQLSIAVGPAELSASGSTAARAGRGRGMPVTIGLTATDVHGTTSDMRLRLSAR
jgi:hypothetical protein